MEKIRNKINSEMSVYTFMFNRTAFHLSLFGNSFVAFIGHVNSQALMSFIKELYALHYSFTIINTIRFYFPLGIFFVSRLMVGTYRTLLVAFFYGYGRCP